MTPSDTGPGTTPPPEVTAGGVADNPAARPTGAAKPTESLSLRERFAALEHLPAFLKLIWQTSPPMALGNALLRLLRAALPLAMLYVGKLIIDEVIALAAASGVGLGGGGVVGDGALPDTTHLWVLVGIELALAVGQDALGRAVALLDSLLGDRFSIESSIRIMSHAAELDMAQFEDSTFYDRLERARRQTLGRTVLMAQVLSQAQDLLTILFLIGGMISFEPWLVVLLIVALVPAFLGESHFNERSYSLVRSWTPERRELDYLRLTGASDETAKEIKIFGLSDFLIDRFRTLSERYYTQNRQLALSRAGWGALLAALGTLGYYGAYGFIILSAVKGAITVGTLTFLAGSFARLRGLFEGSLLRLGQIAEGALYLRDFFEFFRLEPRVTSRPNAHAVPNPIRQGFVFEGVTFRYEGAARPSIDNLSFTLEAGTRLALVGENGAGKTTLVKLLARLYDPTEGRILLDGRDLRDYDLEDLRRQTGVIFQDFVRYQLTASDNIAVGQIDERTDRPRIIAAADLAQAQPVIAGLPQGYEQMIGRRFGGVELSGGQWQKLALSRAYMRQAQLLILDEPTAALDAQAEHDIFERFSHLTQGKTVVLISHRFSTVRMADRVLVLEGGRFKEMGTHAELMAREGSTYARLFRLQAHGYQL